MSEHSTQEHCRVAIIGAGNMAREHLRAFQDLPHVSVVGIYSRTRARAEALATQHGVPTVCESVAELYDRTRADLVVIAVNVLETRGVCAACFEFPWTTLIEKPPGYNLAEAQEVQQAAAEKHRQALVALNRRFLSSSRAALDDLSQSDLPRYIHVYDQQSQKLARAAGHHPLVVDNWMYANSIHVIDYLRMFGRGPVKTVQPIIPWDPETPGVVLTHIQFASGDQGVYEGIWNGPGPWAVTISTAEKRWEMRPLEQATFENQGERGAHSIERSQADIIFKPGFRLQAEMAVAAALGRNSDAPTLAQAMETMTLIRDIFGK